MSTHPAGPREVARHRLTTPGRPSICDEHYPPRPAGALERRPRAHSDEERAFLRLGDGAETWLIKAGAAGAQRVRHKMAEAVDLAKLHGTDEVAHALKRCVDAGRFGDGDLARVLAHQQPAGGDLIPVSRPLRGALAATLNPQLGGSRAMNSENLDRRPQTKAQKAPLRACEQPPRPNGRAEQRPGARFGGVR